YVGRVADLDSGEVYPDPEGARSVRPLGAPVPVSGRVLPGDVGKLKSAVDEAGQQGLAHTDIFSSVFGRHRSAEDLAAVRNQLAYQNRGEYRTWRQLEIRSWADYVGRVADPASGAAYAVPDGARDVRPLVNEGRPDGGNGVVGDGLPGGLDGVLSGLG